MNNKIVIICNNNKDYMSVGIGMYILILSNVSDIFLNYAFIIFYLRNN